MQKFFFSLLCLLFFHESSRADNYSLPPDTASILGRWDITINLSGRQLPSWLEVNRSGTYMLVGEFVGPGGSARPISRINFSNGKLSFSIPPQWEGGKGNLDFEATFQGDSLTGSITFPDGRNGNCTLLRAPSLQRYREPEFKKHILLFNGTNLDGWHATGQVNQWMADNGVLKSPKAGSNLVSDAEFTDFKLHIEFRYMAHGNSGVYLRGRYEVQIADYYEGYPMKDQLGAIYGFLTPNEKAGKIAGEWQSYDITLIGRKVTVVLNGKTIICDAEIPGITGGALNSREAEPGPIMLQGDHEPIEYRNIIISPAELSN